MSKDKSDHYWHKHGNESGKTLLLLHGWMRNRHDLKVLADSLAKYHLVYTLTLPGFPGSELSPAEVANWNLSDYVKYVSSFIEDQGIKPIVFAHSFGGRVAVKLAALYPELLADQLILCGVPGIKQAKSFQQSLRLNSLKYLAKFCKLSDQFFNTSLFQNYFIPNFASADYQSAQELKNVFVKVINEDLAPYASKIQNETLLLWGKNDSEASVAVARAYHALILNSRLRVLDYHAHSPFVDVGGHLCAKIIHEFITAKSVDSNRLVDASELDYPENPNLEKSMS